MPPEERTLYGKLLTVQQAVEKGLVSKQDAPDGEQRIVMGYISTDDIDSDEERITLEALAQSVDKWPGNIRMMHRPIPIGRTIRKYVDSTGLFVEVQLGESTAALDAWADVKAGILDAFSICFWPLQFEKEEVGGEDVWTWTEIEIVEASLVDHPANRAAEVTGFKGLGAKREEEDVDPKEIKEALDESLTPLSERMEGIADSVSKNSEALLKLGDGLDEHGKRLDNISEKVAEMDKGEETPDAEPTDPPSSTDDKGVEPDNADGEEPESRTTKPRDKGTTDSRNPYGGPVVTVGAEHDVTPDQKFIHLCPATARHLAAHLKQHFGGQPALRKALEGIWDSSALASGGAIPDEEVPTFLDLTRTEANLLPLIDYGVTTTPTWKANYLEFEDRQLRGSGEYETAQEGYEPTITPGEGSTTKVRMKVIITWEMVQRNLMGGGLLTWVNSMLAQKFGRDFQDLIINGDDSSADDFLKIMDGMIVSFTADANVHDVDLGTYADWLWKDFIDDTGSKTAGVFNQVMAEAMAEDIANPDNLIWLVSKKDAFSYISELTAPETPQSDRYLTQGVKATGLVLGDPLLATDKFPNEYVLLLHPQNISARIWQSVRIYSEFDGDREATAFNLHADAGWYCPLPARVVMGWDTP